MILFPNAKINIGLNIFGKRSDGYHNIETVMFPIGICDALEVHESSGGKDDISLTTSGISLDVVSENNLIYKAYALLKRDYYLPPVIVHLHKNIPFGAGLGGGSADAVFMLKILNTKFKLNIEDGKLEEYASCIGSDCAFFVKNKPALSSGRGEQLEPIRMNLSGYHLVLVFPQILISTAEAYSCVHVGPPETSLKERINNPVNDWKHLINNNFESGLFTSHPLLRKIKEDFYLSGAVYASLTGSGGALYGLYESEPDPGDWFKDYYIWSEKLL
jgi:4-diphosphocytidyl-2-C-methyl-D-erythritol kinase